MMATGRGFARMKSYSIVFQTKLRATTTQTFAHDPHLWKINSGVNLRWMIC